MPSFRTAPKFSQNVVGHPLLDLRQHGIVLQKLAADVERQVLGIDHAEEKSQVGRQQLFAVIGNEDPPHIKLDPPFAVRVKEVERLA
jgi:hypothetical protein